MLKNYSLYFVFFVLCFTSVNAQLNVVKFIPSYNADITRTQPFKFHLNSFGIGYERCIGEHSSVELLLFRARVISYTPEPVLETKVLNGFGIETRYRYYFQTHDEYITYSPFEFYVSPTLNYTQMQTTYLNDFHTLKYFQVGAVIGFQLILELYQEGFTIDVNTGVNTNFYESSGFINEKEIFSFMPRVGLSFGYCF